LRKAMQKRRLGEMALDEAEFTPAFFKNATNIRDLFSNEESVAELIAPVVGLPKSTKELEAVMANVEDIQDAVAARKAQEEFRAEVAEFDVDENTPSAPNSYLLDTESPSTQYMELINRMKPVERYAINFLEKEYRPELEEEVKEAEALMEAKKEEFLKNKEALSALDRDNTSSSSDENGAAEESELVETAYDVNSIKEEVAAKSKPSSLRRVASNPLKRHHPTSPTIGTAQENIRTRFSNRLKLLGTDDRTPAKISPDRGGVCSEKAKSRHRRL